MPCRCAPYQRDQDLPSDQLSMTALESQHDVTGRRGLTSDAPRLWRCFRSGSATTQLSTFSRPRTGHHLHRLRPKFQFALSDRTHWCNHEIDLSALHHLARLNVTADTFGPCAYCKFKPESSCIGDLRNAISVLDNSLYIHQVQLQPADHTAEVVQMLPLHHRRVGILHALSDSSATDRDCRRLDRAGPCCRLKPPNLTKVLP